MKNMAICIPTRGRADRQITLDNIPTKLKKMTYLIVDKNEYSKHKRYKSEIKDILVMPKGWGNYNGNASDKKQWATENIEERFYFIVDDDLKFDVRKDGRLMKAELSDVYRAFNRLYGWLKNEFAHVALSAREGNNRVVEDFIDVSRAMRVCAFDLKVIHKEKIKMNRLSLMSDFDTTIQLLELGYPNRILYKYANGHRKSNDEGGCSLYRSPQLMEESANGLHNFHRPFVKVTQKKTTKPWAGFDSKVRTDVVVSWKKAYKFGKGKKSKGITDYF